MIDQQILSVSASNKIIIVIINDNRISYDIQSGVFHEIDTFGFQFHPIPKMINRRNNYMRLLHFT